ncbi:MAG TPA: ABC transporter ATP-binding protein [Baekduia sp.]|nr:ABC transporter ATP-binding protein [Baekduia sp.]
MGRLEASIATQLRSFALDVTLSAPAGVLALVGPSGAGKSTILRCIAGLKRPDAGRIALDDQVWFDAAARVDVAPDRRPIGMVFQEYALFPHMTVAKNVGFGGAERVPELLERLSIGHLAASSVNEISGGERQRVALARALARDPRVLLLDEPLSSLDAQTRNVVRSELGALLHELGLPAILVTHDFADAAALADEVAVLVEGEIRQQGTPFELTDAPADAFVASFTGATLFEGIVSDGELISASGTRFAANGHADGPVTAAVYPWDVMLADHGTPATVTAVTPHGGGARVQTDLLRADISSTDATRLEPGDRIVLAFAAEALRLYPRR